MGLERRVTTLEERVTDIETGFGEAIYETNRRVLGLEITLNRVADKLGVRAATDDDIDDAFEARS